MSRSRLVGPWHAAYVRSGYANVVGPGWERSAPDVYDTRPCEVAVGAAIRDDAGRWHAFTRRGIDGVWQRHTADLGVDEDVALLAVNLALRGYGWTCDDALPVGVAWGDATAPPRP